MNVGNDERRALIIQPGALGDGVLTVPLVRMLCRNGYTAVDMMGHVETLSLLAQRSEVGRVISLDSFDLHRLFAEPETFDLPDGDRLIELLRPYELVVTFLADDKGRLERNLIYTACATHQAEVVTLELHPPDEYRGPTGRFFMEQLVEQAGGMGFVVADDVMDKPLLMRLNDDSRRGQELLERARVDTNRSIVAVHPGSGGEHKCWPLENFEKLAHWLDQCGHQALFVLGPVETDRWRPETIARLKEQFRVLQGPELDEVAAILSCCNAYVGNDSGISHVAGAMEVPTLAVFGPSNPVHWRPMGRKVDVTGPPVPQKGWPATETVLDKLKSLVLRSFYPENSLH